jgi:hypothetical protein
MEDEERLNRLTPRERDVYEVWREHPDWSNAQIGRGLDRWIQAMVTSAAP